MVKANICLNCTFFDGENCIHFENTQIILKRKVETIVYKEKADKVKCKNVKSIF